MPDKHYEKFCELGLAIVQEDVETVKGFLQNPQIKEIVAYDEYRAVWMASVHGVEIFALLIEVPGAKDNLAIRNFRILQTALDGKKIEIIKLLMDIPQMREGLAKDNNLEKVKNAYSLVKDRENVWKLIEDLVAPFVDEKVNQQGVLSHASCK